MLKKFPFLFFLILLTKISCKSEAEKVAERNAVIDSTIINFQEKLLENKIDSVFAQNNFNGSISIFQNGGKLYENENGFQDFKTKSKLNHNSVFAIGSLSKQFTAVLVLLQEEQSKLLTKDLVSKFLPEFQAKAYSEITIQHLLNHTSGLNDFGTALLSKPGKDFHYSNKGYLYLGKIVEKVSGKSYSQNAQELFAKAGMRQTFTPNNFADQNFAGANLGNAARNSAVPEMPLRLEKDEISVPAGGILSTSGDLHLWNSALYSGKIISAESLEKFKTSASSREHYVLGTVGYGDGIMMNLGKPEAYFHSGYVKGSPSLLIYYPATKTSVVILSNIADESKGKDEFFRPHAEVKNLMDAIQNSVAAVKAEMLQPETSKNLK